MTEKLEYQILCDEFLNDYKRGETSGDYVGEIIVKMAQYFGIYNLQLVSAEHIFAKKIAEIGGRADDNGKVISSAKAKSIADATDEALLRDMARAHVQNQEAYINALKSLQRGIQNEYSHMGNT